MKDSEELARLLAAERAEQPAAESVTEGWSALKGALGADVPALAVAHGPLTLGVSLVTKSFVGSGLVAFAVTTAGLGIHAAVQPSVAPQPTEPVLAAPPRSAAPAPRPPSADPSAASPAAVSPKPELSAGSREPVSTFAAELRLVKAAKLELNAGREHLARVWLDEHARLYPNGVFRAERESLRQRLHSDPDRGNVSPLPKGK